MSAALPIRRLKALPNGWPIQCQPMWLNNAGTLHGAGENLPLARLAARVGHHRGADPARSTTKVPLAPNKADARKSTVEVTSTSGHRSKVGDIVRVTVTHSDRHDLWGELVLTRRSRSMDKGQIRLNWTRPDTDVLQVLRFRS